MEAMNIFKFHKEWENERKSESASTSAIRSSKS